MAKKGAGKKKKAVTVKKAKRPPGCNQFNQNEIKPK